MVGVQIGAVLCAFGMLALWPPAHGPMMIAPLPGTDTGAVVRAVRAADGLLLGPGLLPGSLVVVGERARFVRIAGTLVVAAPRAGCGAPAEARP